MSDAKKAISSSLTLVALVGAVVGGTVWRQVVDVSSTTGRPNLTGYLASKSTDAQLSEVDFFKEVTLLLKREYVDPVDNDQKLASGAVRGMIQSLGDVHSQFMDPAQFKIFQAMREGRYEGIGAEFALKSDTGNSALDEKLDDASQDEAPDPLASAIRVPKLVVLDVVPDGPAAKAGIQAGDVIDSVNGRWIINAKAIIDFRAAQKKLRANQITREDYAKLHKDIRLKIETNMLPLRARERLTTGTDGTVDVSWLHGGKLASAKIGKASSTMPTFQASGASVTHLTFNAEAPDALAQALKGQTGEVTLDLRHNVVGDYDAMRKCLVPLLPAGSYGFVATMKDAQPKAFAIGKGTSEKRSYKLIVDKTTLGPARVFAAILKKYANASVVGAIPPGEATMTKVVALPDGSGYTLNVGEYKSTAPKQAAKLEAEVKA